jgi:hypothetical protein
VTFDVAQANAPVDLSGGKCINIKMHGILLLSNTYKIIAVLPSD